MISFRYLECVISKQFCEFLVHTPPFAFISFQINLIIKFFFFYFYEKLLLLLVIIFSLFFIIIFFRLN